MSIVINIGIAICTLFVHIFQPYVFDEDFLTLYLLFGGGAILTFILTKESVSILKHQFFRPSILFLLGYIIVFFQKNIDLMIGYITPNNNIFNSPNVILDAAFLADIGISVFIIGYLSVRSSKPSIQHRYYTKRPYSIRFTQACLIGVIVLYYLFVGMDILNGTIVYGQDMIESNGGTISGYLSVAVIEVFFAYSAVFIYVNTPTTNTLKKYSFTKFLKKYGIGCNICIVLYIFIQMSLGARSYVIFIGIVYLVSFMAVSKRKISLAALGLIMFLGVCWSVTLGLGNRSHATEISELLDTKSEFIEYQSILPMTTELANSYRIFTLVLLNIPDRHDYLYGSLQLRELLAYIPFSGQLGLKQLFNPHFRYINSPMFCTWLDQGERYTYGSGSALLADIYLNFGAIGIVFSMFLLGRLVRKLDLCIYDPTTSIWWLLAALTFIGCSIYISRATLLTPLYFFIPALILVLISNYIYNKNKAL